MRRALALVLLFTLLLSALPACAEENQPLYRAQITGGDAGLYEDESEAHRIAYVKKGTYVRVYEVTPKFARIEANGTMGYVYRSRLDQVTAIDSVNTPPYGVEVFRYMATAVCDTPVYAAADSAAQTLITLHEGARFAFIGAENGWAKVIYHRQYGYIDTRLLSEIVMVKSAADEAALDAPIAVYTSYYKITTTEANIGRMKNIATACEKLSAITLQPGETLNFNSDIGPYTERNGYHKAPVLADGKTKLNYGGGTCQVSSTLYNVVLQLPGLTVVKRRAHGANGASYLPHGVDAAVGNKNLNFIFRNDYDFPVRIDASSQDGALYISIWRADSL